MKIKAQRKIIFGKEYIKVGKNGKWTKVPSLRDSLRVTSYSEKLLKNEDIYSFLHSKKIVYKKLLIEGEK